MSDHWHIGIDLGTGTYKAGLISPDWKIVTRTVQPTYAAEGAEQGADRIAASVRELMNHLPEAAQVVAVGICSPGPIDHKTGMIIDPPNLRWHHVPFASMLSERLNLPVYLEHDAKASALGEFHFGAGRGARDMALIIVGTGIGAAMILDGELYRGANDAAGEVGHITVDLHGPICTCGSKGCVETLAGGPAIMAAYSYATRKSITSAKEVADAALAGDDIALQVFERAGRALGAAIATMAMLNDITTFVLFGSVVQAGDLLLEPARRAIPDYAHKSISARVRVVVGELGNDAGILGAAWAAWSASTPTT